ncbi:MAG: hypothetical protein H6907_12560 [Hyphomicrobiales bacterium]|nr:hypothetical protein [Hyphomicrobiales bacterium]MCP5372554.1 hypothetical protein [Hyphomicrobiales bacterium]
MAVTLEFDVWQFVRVMDALEAGRRPKGSVYAAWAEVWSELDRRLAALAGSDPDAYAELMMDRQVTVDCAPAQVAEVATAVEGVIRRLDRELRAKPTDRHLRDSLRFEKREMEDLLARLRVAQKR